MTAAEPAPTPPERTASGRRARNSLSAEEIVNGAFELADEVTLAEFSVPRLARHLGVGVTGIYWYFRKKQDLLDAMTDRAVSDYHEATPFVGADDWQDGLRRHFRRMRRTLQRHPVLVELMLLRSYSGTGSRNSLDQTSAKLDTIIAVLVEAGFSRDEALEIYLSLLSHVLGAAMIHNRGTLTGEPGDPAASGSSLAQALAARGHRVDDLDELTFDYGLEAILARAAARLR